ncbi:CAP domain-containing protein [Patulibacter sp.]|uniref:CAP domain-containing protein n=1 Tax=Patulibacter sp. TaxID=1912859 RepID=UPI0027236A31|nr:CAP domain-containing protein [Patulibacter sp.]MDO9408345.1 CAP domain-containing protein [Patulibacter sp.]
MDRVPPLLRPATVAAGVLTAGLALAAGAPAASAACAGANRTVASQGATKAEAAVLCLVNERRTSAGLKSLTASSGAATAAQRHTNDMVRRRYFDHRSPGGSTVADRVNATGLRWSALGENIAVGQRTPAAVMRGWMKSPGHRANIMKAGFRVLGVGVSPKGTRGYSGSTWTQVFARPR